MTNDGGLMQDRTAQLETEFINEYLVRFGHDPEVVRRSDDPKMRTLLREATLHASGQLATVAARARLLEDMQHGNTGNLRRPRR